MMTSAKDTLEATKETLETAKKIVDSSQKDVNAANVLLETAEEQWGVIDIDAMPAPAPKKLKRLELCPEGIQSRVPLTASVSAASMLLLRRWRRPSPEGGSTTIKISQMCETPPLNIQSNPQRDLCSSRFLRRIPQGFKRRKRNRPTTTEIPNDCFFLFLIVAKYFSCTVITYCPNIVPEISCKLHTNSINSPSRTAISGVFNMLASIDEERSVRRRLAFQYSMTASVGISHLLLGSTAVSAASRVELNLF